MSTGQPADGVGLTFGVEEEYHVVDAETFAVRDDSGLIAAVLAGRFGPDLHAEISTTQIETTTGVCTSLGQVRSELVQRRQLATRAAGSVGATVLAASTHPCASWEQQRLTSSPHYIALLERWRLLALQQVICGCHVHVGIPDLDTAVAVMDRVRPYLPLVLALTCSSPFHEGRDTGHDSYRTLWWGRWPISGSTEPLGSGAAYLDVVDGLRAAGAVDGSSGLYWDVRPSAKYPTLEYRVADVCTSVDDAVLHAAIVSSLTRVLASRAIAGDPVPEVRPELLRAARWRAARDGMSGQLLDPVRRKLVDARMALSLLLAELRDDLEDRAEWNEVSGLAERALDRGTSAVRQRHQMLRTGDLLEVAALVVRDGTVG